MKAFHFTNGKTRFESQMPENRTFEKCCILWGCYDEETGEPLPYTVTEATDEELLNEQARIEAIREEYEEVMLQNELTARGNRRVMAATNEDEFMNAYLQDEDLTTDELN